MRRSICLNGEWDFMPVYKESMLQNGMGEVVWEQEKLRVPSSWRYLLTNTNKEQERYRPYDMFRYPVEWNDASEGIIGRRFNACRKKDEKVWLVFNGILQRSAVYINNQLVHRSEEAFLPQRIDITDYIPFGESEVDLKVWCGSFKNVETQNGQKHVAPDGTWFAGMARGIWQDVFLEYTSASYINDFQIKTSWREKTITIIADNVLECEKATNVTIKANLYGMDGKEEKVMMSDASESVQAGAIRLVMCDSWENARCWSPEDPYLYMLKLELLIDGAIADVVTKQTGFREVWFDAHRFYLNGIRVNLRGDAWHYQGFATQTKEYAMNWYKMCRENGINFVRLHAMPFPEIFLEAADETGMLIIDESAIYGAGKSIQADHPEYIDNCRKHLEALVKRDRNHPCVIIWSMQNEMRWVDGRDVFKEHIKSLMETIEELDGTRLISCDGDNRLVKREDMQIMSMHYNIDGTVKDWDKSLPLIFGEHGKWHYISPQVSSELVGPDAYLSFDAAMRNLGMSEKMFLEYARKEEVTGISPFNFVNYMMMAMPDTDKELQWDDLSTPGVKPRVIVNHSLTINNGLLHEEADYIPNASLAAIRDGVKPEVIIPDEYNNAFYSGTHISRNFSVYNDTMNSVEAKIKYHITDSYGNMIIKDTIGFYHTAGERHSMSISFTVPETEETQTLKLTMVLYHDGIQKHVFVKEYRVFPKCLKTSPVDCHGAQICYVGSEKGLKILNALAGDVIVVGDITAESLKGIDVLIIGSCYEGDAKRVQPVLQEFTLRGGILIILEQKDFSVGDVTLAGRRYFKSFINTRKHRVFNGLDDEDMGFWDASNIFDHSCRYMVENCFNKPVHGDFEILMECGEGDFGWGGLLWTPLIEYKNGLGKVMLNQLELTENFNTVPQAGLLLRNILEYAIEQTHASREYGKTALLSENPDFCNFFEEVKLDYDWGKSEEALEGKRLAVIDPLLFDRLNIEKLKKFMEYGGTVLTTDVKPQQSELIVALCNKKVIIAGEPAYQTQGLESEMLNGVSAFDLYRYEAVTYSPATRKNIPICDYCIDLEDGVNILSNVNNPWYEYFIEHLDAEPIKISIATMNQKRQFNKKYYAAAVNVGKGRLIVCQVRLDSIEKNIRLYSRLLANLGAHIRTELLVYIKEKSDYAVDTMMGLSYNGKAAFDQIKQHFSDRKFVLNNLGECVYGWMTRYEKTDGYISIPGSSNKIFFMTVFIESEINRNPLKRENGQLPDSSIVPDLYINANCSFELWVNGVLYKIHNSASGDTETVKVDDVLLDKGINPMLLVMYGGVNDIKFSTTYINKYGDPVNGLNYRLTLD